MTPATPLFDPVKVVASVRTLHAPGTVFELRVLNARLDGGHRLLKSVSGFFDSPEALVRELPRISSAMGIYVTLNPINPALLCRAINRINGDSVSDFAAKDSDVVRRQWLLLDCDPHRAKGVSATDGELEKAKAKAKQIHAFLKDRGWSPPVCALSGNGTHLLYKIDLPADDGELLKRVLLALSQKFDDEGVEVDRAVFNPSRITKCYGTQARKGDHSPERPHRMSEILKAPATPGIVTKEQLEEVAALAVDDNPKTQASPAPARSPTATTARKSGNYDANAFVDEFITKHGIEVHRTENKGGDVYHLLELCPWSSTHGGADNPGDSAIIVQADGTLGFKCFHSHCADKHWRDLRLLYEPDFEQLRQERNKRYAGGRFATTDKTDMDADPESAELKAMFFEVIRNGDMKANEKHASMAKAAVEVLHKRGRFFFHSDRRDFNSTMFFDGRRKLLSLIPSDAFQAWLSEFSGLNISETAFDFVLSACKTEALAGDTTGIVPSAYWHGTPTAVYLSNGDGHAVRITAGKVEMVDNGTDDVLFASGQTLQPWALVEPVDPFLSCKLFSDMATTPQCSELLRLWVLSLPTGQRCKPPTVITGPIGGGKTRLAVGISELLGMAPRIVALTENGEADFWTQLDSGGLVCFDNADTKIRWLADALAAAATDGSHEKRQLYSDSKIVRQQARAWVVVTSANPTFAADAGLADRLLVTRLERRARETAESALSKEIAANRDAGLSWIARTISVAMSDREPVRCGNLNRRHPDFARIAVKFGRAMGREAEAIAALQMAEADKGRFNLENDEVGAALLELGDWQGSATELLEALVAIDAGFDGKWSAKRLGKRIARLWPHLESVLHATREADGHSKQAVYHFAGFAGFQNAISGKVYISPSREEFRQNTSPNPANPADAIPQDANGSFSMSSTTAVQKVYSPEDDGYADRGNTATLARLTPEQARHFFHDTTVWGEDGRIREGSPEELVAEYAEVSKYFVRTVPVPEHTDAAIQSDDWQPGDPVATSTVIVGKPELCHSIPNFGLGSIDDPLGEHVDLFAVQDDW